MYLKTLNRVHVFWGISGKTMANQRDGSFGLYMPEANQKNRPFGLWFEAEA